jgi:YVTN family beta-propeller protein
MDRRADRKIAEEPIMTATASPSLPARIPVHRAPRRSAIALVSLLLAGTIGLGSVTAQNAFVHWESPHVHPLELSSDGSRLVAVNTADHRIEVYDINASLLPVHQRSIAVGLDPVSVRLRSTTEAWVVNHMSDTISVVDIASGQLLHTIATGDEPADVVFAGTPQRAFVTISSRRQLQVFDAATPGAALNTLTLEGQEPRSLAVSPDGSRVYVGLFESGNGSTAVRLQDVSNPAGPYGGTNPPPNSGLQFSPPRNPTLPPPPRVAQIVRKDANGAWRDDNNRDWSQFVSWNVADNDVAIINSSSLSVSYVPHMMTMVMALNVAPDGQVAVVGTEAKNEIRFEPNVKSIFIRAQVGSFAQSSPGSFSVADLNPQLSYAVRSVSQEVRNQAIGDPRAIAIHPGNGEWFVAGMGSNNVIVTNASGTRLGRIDVGQGPTGLALNADGSRLYVLNKFDASISTLDTDARSELDRQAFFDPTPVAIKEGRPLLYDTHATSGLGQASCASCHVDNRLDGLAWDLGDPSGSLKAINQPCRPNQVCDTWHPMKGPMVTQSLQGIVGNGAMHWRGDKENVAAFAPAYVGLQGDDAEPSAADMQKLENFIASVSYPPNPNRNPDGSFLASMQLANGNGNPATGLTLFQTIPVLPGNATCNTCHTLPNGTSGEIDNPAGAPQALKTTQLRGTWEKTGMSFTSQNNTRGFGFMSDSHIDTLAARLGPPFNFGGPAVAAQRQLDVEAFLLAFDTETPAAVGRTVSFDGSNNNDPTAIALLSSLTAQADAGSLALIARSYTSGGSTGYVYATQAIWLSDRENQPGNADTLRSNASAAAPVSFIAVPINTQFRTGVDRDADGVFDQDEIDNASDPADASSLPSAFCRADFDGNGTLDAADLIAFTNAHSAGNPRANWDRSFGSNGLPSITQNDLDQYQIAFAAGCTTLGETLFTDGFE